MYSSSLLFLIYQTGCLPEVAITASSLTSPTPLTPDSAALEA